MRKIASVLKSFSALVAVATVASFPSAVSAQQAMYPLKEGIVQPFNYQDMPSWMKLDFELRGRTENQSSLTEIQNKDRAYELTRVWGGVTVVPTNWLTFYATVSGHPCAGSSAAGYGGEYARRASTCARAI